MADHDARKESAMKEARLLWEGQPALWSVAANLYGYALSVIFVALHICPAIIGHFRRARRKTRRGLVDTGADHGGCADYSGKANSERKKSRQQKRSHAHFLLMVRPRRGSRRGDVVEGQELPRAPSKRNVGAA
ncbi:MAG: hypothetical protein ACREHV_16000 [Rhizomicrobium sp.]